MVFPGHGRAQLTCQRAVLDAQEFGFHAARLSAAAGAYDHTPRPHWNVVSLATLNVCAWWWRRRPVWRRVQRQRRVCATPRPVRLRAVHLGRRLLHPRCDPDDLRVQ